MRYTSIDKITRSYLLQKNYPMHYYLNAAKYATDCLRELTFDTLRVVNTVKLDLNSYYAVDLPCDFVSLVKVGIEVGQLVKPLAYNPQINRLRNTNTSGEYITYGEPVSDVEIFLSGSLGIYWGTVMWDDNNEFTGRMFGFRGDYGQDTYKIVLERGQIQFNENIGATSVVLEYISDGQTTNNATQITPFAQKAIECYIDWQFKLHGRQYGNGERQEAERQYNKELRILRARVSALTIDDIKRIFTTNYSAGAKF